MKRDIEAVQITTEMLSNRELWPAWAIIHVEYQSRYAGLAIKLPDRVQKLRAGDWLYRYVDEGTVHWMNDQRFKDEFE